MINNLNSWIWYSIFINTPHLQNFILTFLCILSLIVNVQLLVLNKTFVLILEKDWLCHRVHSLSFLFLHDLILVLYKRLLKGYLILRCRVYLSQLFLLCRVIRSFSWMFFACHLLGTLANQSHTSQCMLLFISSTTWWHNYRWLCFIMPFQRHGRRIIAPCIDKNSADWINRRQFANILSYPSLI